MLLLYGQCSVWLSSTNRACVYCPYIDNKLLEILPVRIKLMVLFSYKYNIIVWHTIQAKINDKTCILDLANNECIMLLWPLSLTSYLANHIINNVIKSIIILIESNLRRLQFTPASSSWPHPEVALLIPPWEQSTSLVSVPLQESWLSRIGPVPCP